MTGRGLSVCTVFFVAGLIPTLPAATDDAVRVEVERPQLVVDNTITQSPSRAAFKLTFDARFTNQSKIPVDIPDLAELHGGLVGITWNGVETQQSDGSWRFLVPGGMLLWKADTVFADCKSLGPNETAELKRASHRLTVDKSNLGGLGPKVILRLALVLSCKQRDLKTMITNPFSVSIPPLP